MSRNMKIAVAAAAGLVTAFVVYRIYCAFLPEETRIRKLVERIQEGFNSAEAGTVSRGLAEDFAEEESGLGRNEVRLILFDFFRSEVDRGGRFLFRVEAPPEDTEVEIQEGKPEAAEISVKARFFARTGDGWIPYGTILFTASLSKPDGDWRIRRAWHKRLEGKWPF